MARAPLSGQWSLWTSHWRPCEGYAQSEPRRIRHGHLPVEVPAEIRQAAEACDAMQVRIQRLLDERNGWMADVDEMSAMISRTTASVPWPSRIATKTACVC